MLRAVKAASDGCKYGNAPGKSRRTPAAAAGETLSRKHHTPPGAIYGHALVQIASSGDRAKSVRRGFGLFGNAAASRARLPGYPQGRRRVEPGPSRAV